MYIINSKHLAASILYAIHLLVFASAKNHGIYEIAVVAVVVVIQCIDWSDVTVKRCWGMYTIRAINT